MLQVAIGVDVGGTTLAGCLLTRDGELLSAPSRPCPVVDGCRDPGLVGTLAFAGELVGEARRRELDPIALGAGFPEYVDPAGRLTSREVLAWETQPLPALAGLLAPGRACVVDSDVRCGALAEARLGAARPFHRSLYVSLGTGLSCALVEGGVPVPGRRGEAIGLNAFEVSARVDRDWPGDLEAYCSGEGVRRRYLTAGGAGAAGTVTGAREIVALAAAGEPLAVHTLATAGDALAAALAGLVAVLDPDALVLGGGLGCAPGGSALHDALVAGLADRLAGRPDPPPLLVAELGPTGGARGAALRALDCA